MRFVAIVIMLAACGDNAPAQMSLDAATEPVDALPNCFDVSPTCEPQLAKPCGVDGCSCDPDGRSGPATPVACVWPSCASFGPSCQSPTTIDRVCANGGACYCDVDGQRERCVLGGVQ